MWILLAAAPHGVQWLFVLGGLVGVAACAWLGWKNLEQSKLLCREIPPARLGGHVGEVVTVRGRPESLYQGSDPFLDNWLWFHKKFQQRRSSFGRRNEGWRTVRDEFPEFGMRLTLDDGSTVLIRNDAPTETYGTEKQTQGGGFGSQTRVKVKFLPKHLPHLTACGRLERTGESLMIVKDQKMGLLLSTHKGADQAKIETIKGWLGLVAAPLGYLMTLGYFLSR